VRFVEIPDENLKDIQTRNFEHCPSSLSGGERGQKKFRRLEFPPYTVEKSSF
jgi:hypothetical protein